MKYMPCIFIALFFMFSANAEDKMLSNSHNITKACGESIINLSCINKSCTKSKLFFKTADGKVIYPPIPKELGSHRSAVGLACLLAPTESYIQVEYSEMPFDCEYCEFFYLYNQKGVQLTHNIPLFIKVSGQPDGKNIAPNNTQFNILFNKLNLKQSNIDYLSADISQ